jgi:hypothetical protein
VHASVPRSRQDIKELHGALNELFQLVRAHGRFLKNFGDSVGAGAMAERLVAQDADLDSQRLGRGIHGVELIERPSIEG